MEQTQDRTAPSERSGEWSKVDELNWAADRTVLRDLKKRGEDPSTWLATEYRELNIRRKPARRG